MQTDELEKIIQEKGSSILKQARQSSYQIFNKNWWYGKVLSWTMKSNDFKTNLFHFIDVLPSLETPEQILSHLNEYFKDQDLKYLTSGLGSLAPTFMAKTIKKQVNEMAKIFITGSTIKEGLKIIPKIRNKNQCFSFDILGEATLSEKEALKYQEYYSNLMEELIQTRDTWKPNDLIDTDPTGKIPSINISIKVSSLCHYIKEEAWEFTKEEMKKKLRPLFQKAVKNFIFINLDMEQYRYKTLIKEVFKELLLEPNFKKYPHFGIVVQAYLKESFSDLKDLIAFSKQRGQPITIRLVKGAYWDSEVLTAKQQNWPIPVYTVKEDTDANFEQCLEFLFKNNAFIKMAVGSHNIRSISKALALHQFYPKANLEFQVLYGVGETISHRLIEEGYRVRLYSTIGNLIPGMSYLVRRLLENTANQSFILATLSQDQSEKQLLKIPTFSQPHTENKKPLKDHFENTPLLDFTIKENRVLFQKNLELWKNKFPITVPIILNGEEHSSSHLWKRKNPSDIQQIVSCTHFADTKQAEQSVEIASDFFEQWQHTDPKKRIQYLKNLAVLMKKKEFELATLQVFEVGKTWLEAHADVCESIDFCNYYADSFLQLSSSKKTCEISGEESLAFYQAIGPTAIIAPWNFPLAILTGMVVAPLVCGNTVLIKPAEQSSLIAYELAKLLLQSGFPKESFSFLPGQGEKIGSYLVKHPKIPIISFTGSFEVGSQIIQETKSISKKQKHIKKNIVEMGGKNAIVVDLSADLDEAISGILTSAFSFQGQKCSACSRVLIIEEIYDKFITRFIPAVESLIIDKSENPKTFLGPVVDESSYKKIKSFLKTQTISSQKIYESKNLEGGWFIPPIVFLTDQADCPLMQEELFAPVLTLFKVKNFEEAIKQTNNTRYGLTAALYSRRPSHIEKFKQWVEAGNIYINRNCTGALVQRHPFGGYKMSGLGSKTGGPEYLKQFLNQKITTENTMRRGFAPEIFSKDFLKEI